MTEVDVTCDSLIANSENNHENKLELFNSKDEHENNHNTNSQIEILTKTNKTLEDQLKLHNNDKIKMKEEMDNLQSHLTNLKSELRIKVDHLNRIYEDEKHDKESMVLKFAQAEQKNLDTLKKVKELESRLRESKWNFDQIANEKEKLSKELKSRISDFSTYERELNNLKASLTIAEQKIKMEKVRFDEEIERNRETKKKHDELQRSILVLKEENSTLRTNCQEIVKKYQNSEDMLSNSLSTSLRQMKEELKKCIEEKKEAVENHSKISLELQVNKSTINSLNQELKNLKEKIKHVEADKMCQEETVKQLKDAIKSLTFVKDQLTERIANLEPFESRVDQVTQENDRLIVTNTELRKINEDNEGVLSTLRQKESELLEFIQSLSNKNAELQTEKQELSEAKEKSHKQIMKIDLQYKEAVTKINFWENKSKVESKNWLEEREQLSKQIDHLTNDLKCTNNKLSDSDDQIYSLQKKHKAHIKDLIRQLTKSNAPDINKVNETKEIINNMSVKSMQMSCSASDESGNSNQNLNEKDDSDCSQNPNKSQLTPFINGKLEYYSHCQPTMSPTQSNSQPLEVQMIEPHNQILVDKIIRLQQYNAKLQEKIEFLTEHTIQLTQDIQKKSLLIRYLFSQSEEKGSVKSDLIDDNHSMIAKKGGIMASVFSSRQADENLTLELSLEINRRLQSVLEDTTIKNFTLKDSINTLGEEISKLSSENHKLKNLLNVS